MNFIDDFTQELSIEPNTFCLSIINEINTFVLTKLNIIKKSYLINENKFDLLSYFVNIGLELEDIILNKNKNIISEQIKLFSDLFKPIINKIKNICFELNIQLTNELKNTFNDIMYSNNDKYLEQKKNIKFLQINNFCKLIYHTKIKDYSFEDFGINIKISNIYCKDVFINLIESIKIFEQPNNQRDRKNIDWIWKAFNHTPLINLIDIYQNIQISEDNNTLNFVADTDIQNVNSNECIMTENFKIIQKEPEIISKNKYNITNLENSNISEKTNSFNNTEYNFENSLKSKIISDSIIIEDDSFIIPIENVQDYSY